MKIIYTLLFLLLTICILTNSELSLAYALLGLNLWFEKMIPALLPFMILSGIMIRMNLTQNFSRILSPVIRPLYQVSENACYAIIMGFLCGFPMGAKTIADLLKREMISEREAAFLLAFCNNIGPIYFCSFVLPLLGRELVLPYVFGMYGLPLLYGLFLRYTRYSDITSVQNICRCKNHRKHFNYFLYITKHHTHNDKALQVCSSTLANHALTGICVQTHKSASSVNGNNRIILLDAIDNSITSSIQNILSLGGYMILFSLLNLPFHILCGKMPVFLAPLFEITGGLKISGGHFPLYALLLLPFGGMSCIAQTYNCIKGTSLSIAEYALHKTILTILTGFYYLGWFILFSSSFLR